MSYLFVKSYYMSCRPFHVFGAKFGSMPFVPALLGTLSTWDIESPASTAGICRAVKVSPFISLANSFIVRQRDVNKIHTPITPMLVQFCAAREVNV